LQQQNHEITNAKLEKSELQKKILSIKEKLQTNFTKRSKEFKDKINSQQKPITKGFLSHRGAIPKYIKEDEYLLIQKSKDEVKSKEISNNFINAPQEIAELYLLTNENSGLEHRNNGIIHEEINENQGKKTIGNNYNMTNNNSRSLNESDLEKLLNNPNIQPSNKRMDYQNFNFSQKNNVSLFNTVKQQKFEKMNKNQGNFENFMARKFSLDEKNSGIMNNLEAKAKKIGNAEILKQDLNVLKEKISNTLGKYKAKNEKLKEINMFLYNKIKRDSII